MTEPAANPFDNLFPDSTQPAAARQPAAAQVATKNTRGGKGGREQDDDKNSAETKTRKPDWDAIEIEYQTGVLSASALAKKFGLHHSTVCDRAKNYEWSRNLPAKVRRRAEHELIFGRPDGDVAPGADGQTVDDHASNEAIDKAAAVQVELVRQHRIDLSRLRAIQTTLVAKCERLADQRTSLKKSSELREMAQTVDALARLIGRVVPLERQAFNLDAERGPNADTAAVERRVQAFAERKAASRDDPQAVGRAKALIRDANDARTAGKKAPPPGSLDARVAGGQVA